MRAGKKPQLTSTSGTSAQIMFIYCASLESTVDHQMCCASNHVKIHPIHHFVCVCDQVFYSISELYVMPSLRRHGYVHIVALLLTFFCWIHGSIAPAQGMCNEEEVRTRYSLYAEDFKNGLYSSALPNLKWIIRCAPAFGTTTDRNFRRLVETYEGIAMANKDASVRVVYLDSALAVFDTAPDAITNAGISFDAFKWVFNKGYFLQAHIADVPEKQDEVIDLYKKAYELDPGRLEQYYINYIIKGKVEKGEKEAALDFIQIVEVDHVGNVEIQKALEEWRERLLTSPGERISFLQNQMARHPDDTELKNELLQLYLDKEYREEALDLVTALIEEAPSSSFYLIAATMRFEDGFEDEAIALFEKALALESTPNRISEIELKLGGAHQHMGRFAKARTHITRALKASPGLFDGLIAMGDIFTAAVQACPTFERDDRAVYWLATDYYLQALSVGNTPESSQIAEGRMNRIKPYFPTEADKFFEEWQKGDEFVIDYGCYTWIKESTTVR